MSSSQARRQRIWVAGHKGMVGSAIARQLEARGDDVLKVDRSVVDLRNQIAVEVWLKQNRPALSSSPPPKLVASTQMTRFLPTSSTTTWQSRRM
jgi:nucleoside-diphosphate-sugar epimerase